LHFEVDILQGHDLASAVGLLQISDYDLRHGELGRWKKIFRRPSGVRRASGEGFEHVGEFAFY
jgi:hypothetical protein